MSLCGREGDPFLEKFMVRATYQTRLLTKKTRLLSIAISCTIFSVKAYNFLLIRLKISPPHQSLWLHWCKHQINLTTCYMDQVRLKTRFYPTPLLSLSRVRPLNFFRTRKPCWAKGQGPRLTPGVVWPRFQTEQMRYNDTVYLPV